jgi:hypothetical protein
MPRPWGSRCRCSRSSPPPREEELVGHLGPARWPTTGIRPRPRAVWGGSEAGPRRPAGSAQRRGVRQ